MGVQNSVKEKKHKNIEYLPNLSTIFCHFSAIFWNFFVIYKADFPFIQIELSMGD